jgi:hypothetical protein
LQLRLHQRLQWRVFGSRELREFFSLHVQLRLHLSELRLSVQLQLRLRVRKRQRVRVRLRAVRLQLRPSIELQSGKFQTDDPKLRPQLWKLQLRL